MIQYHVYPGGKKRVVTFSYDDGSKNDARLIALFNKYGVRGTFHLNGMKYMDADEKTVEELRALYAGHEVACHTLRHGWPARMPAQEVVREVVEDRKVLERVFGYPVIGMSYPSGSYDPASVSAMRACGIVYSRTTKSTKNFPFPEDYMLWHPTCHHKDALALCESFIRDLDSEWTHPLFYIWGHSHEFRTEEDWAYIEKVVATLANNDKIWYAANIDIYNYVTAQAQLQISYDETMFYNPTATDVWVERNKREIIKIPAGQRIVVPFA